MSFPQSVKWRTVIVTKQWQNIDKVVAYKELLLTTDMVMDLGGYLDRYKWFNKIKRIVNNTRM
jgi:hypothetical protein